MTTDCYYITQRFGILALTDTPVWASWVFFEWVKLCNRISPTHKLCIPAILNPSSPRNDGRNREIKITGLLNPKYSLPVSFYQVLEIYFESVSGATPLDSVYFYSSFEFCRSTQATSQTLLKFYDFNIRFEKKCDKKIWQWNFWILIPFIENKRFTPKECEVLIHK